MKNRLDLYQIQKRPISDCFSLTMTSVNAFVILLKTFFNIFLPTHTQTDMKAYRFTPAAHVRAG